MSELPVGQVILVYLRNPGATHKAGVALEEPRLESRFGETFLVGRVPRNKRDWASGLEAAVRWDEVQHYLVFATKADYDARIESSPAFWEMAEGDQEAS